MGAGEPGEGAERSVVVGDGLVRMCSIHPFLIMVEPIERDLFLFHLFRGTDPTVVVDLRVCGDDVELLLVPAESLCALPGSYADAVADDAYLVAIPVARGLVVVVVAVEVSVAEQKPFDLTDILVASHLFDEDRQILLVYDLVGLEVEAPVAGTGIERDVGLDRIDRAMYEVLRIPDGFDDSEFVAPDVPEHLGGIVLRIPGGHDEFVTDRQNGGDRLDDRVVKLDRVADEGEATDFHGVPSIEMSSE